MLISQEGGLIPIHMSQAKSWKSAVLDGILDLFSRPYLLPNIRPGFPLGNRANTYSKINGTDIKIRFAQSLVPMAMSSDSFPSRSFDVQDQSSRYLLPKIHLRFPLGIRANT